MLRVRCVEGDLQKPRAAIGVDVVGDVTGVSRDVVAEIEDGLDVCREAIDGTRRLLVLQIMQVLLLLLVLVVPQPAAQPPSSDVGDLPCGCVTLTLRALAGGRVPGHADLGSARGAA